MGTVAMAPYTARSVIEALKVQFAIGVDIIGFRLELVADGGVDRVALAVIGFIVGITHLAASLKLIWGDALATVKIEHGAIGACRSYEVDQVPDVEKGS